MSTYRSQKLIALVCTQFSPRVVKIAFGLKQIGHHLILIHNNCKNIGLHSNLFDVIKEFVNPEEALQLVHFFDPTIIHVFSHWNFDVAAYLILHEPKRTVFDNYDQLAGMLNSHMSMSFHSQIEKERFCIENAAANCCRSLELQFAKKSLGYHTKGSNIFFPDYCWDNANFIVRKQQKTHELHLVFVGNLTLERLNSQYARLEGYYLEFAYQLADNGIHFHLYPNPFVDIEPSAFNDYYELEAKTPYVHLHKSLPNHELITEISQYTLGVHTSWFEVMNTCNTPLGYEPIKHFLCTSNKLFDYIDAGLGILVGDYETIYHLANRKDLAIKAHFEDAIRKLKTTSSKFFQNLPEKLLLARSEYSILKQIYRLDKFYDDCICTLNYSKSRKSNAAEAPQTAIINCPTYSELTEEHREHMGEWQLNWIELVGNPCVKLYAGDIPEEKEYKGWIGLSITKCDHRHILHDITNPFPLANNSVNAFQAEDVLEHIPYDHLLPIVNEIFRILKPGGLFRLSVPDYGCDVLRDRSCKDGFGNIVFDPGGGGTPENPGHVWFPRIDTVYAVLAKSKFETEGTMDFLHYWNPDGTSFTLRPIDYGKGMVMRTPDFDGRVRYPRRPMSIVVDLTKSV